MSNIAKYYKDGWRSRTTKVEWGGSSITTIAMKGYVQPISGNETFQEGKNGERVSHRYYTYVSSDIIYGDEILQDGVKYIAVYTDQVGGITNRGHHKEILVERLV